MKRRAVVFVLAILALVALASCSGSGMQCTKVAVDGGGHIACSGSLDKLTGKQAIDFDLEDLVVGGAISAKINIQVTSGTLEVTYEDIEGKSINYIVSPEKPLALEDEMSVVSGNQAEVMFDSEAATAGGISYSAEFTE